MKAIAYHIISNTVYILSIPLAVVKSLRGSWFFAIFTSPILE